MADIAGLDLAEIAPWLILYPGLAIMRLRATSASQVLAELDATRRGYLLSQVTSVEQALLTATDLDMFSDEFRKQAALWEVKQGIVSESFKE